ncbi:MAG: tRNA dihydrouridine synthase DusB [Candidatus Zixiibacteriota bacterium]|nr:MAG: tRNA dihydrouridine synthase DusB [candidate division Zixibacteria bacterium]
MRLGNLNRSRPVLLAPLAGVSDRPFRLLAGRAGAALTYTEMVSSEGIIRRQRRTLDLMRFGSDERPIGIQLFGANPEVMCRAARFVAENLNPDLIDINLGCPVKKVVRKSGGAAILKDLALTADLLGAAVDGASPLPVTAKIRTGWDDNSPVYIEVGQIAEKSGVKALTLHARSRAGGYGGEADWSAIKDLKEALGIPVIGNGDVFSASDAGRMFARTGCDAIMIGRAAIRNPLIFGHINHFLQTGALLPEPTARDKMDMALRHAALMAEQYGEERGTVRMRKYLGWYIRGFPGAGKLRPRLLQVDTIDDIRCIFDDYCLTDR